MIQSGGTPMPRVERLFDDAELHPDVAIVVEFVHGTRDGERLAMPEADAGTTHVFEGTGEVYRRRIAPTWCSATGEPGVWHYDLVPDADPS